jgi:putative ABC transport system substrate-binding protein
MFWRRPAAGGNSMKKKLFAALSASAILLAGCQADSKPVIGVAQLVDQTSLNIIRDAMFDEFEELGYKDGENVVIDYQNAAGKAENLNTIFSQFQSEDAAAVVAITTAAAQSAQNFTDSYPVIFSAVADPVGAGIVKDLEHPEGNITGTSFEVQVDQIIDLIMELNPDAKTIGALYTPGEVNGVSTLNRFKTYAKEKGLEVIDGTGTDLTTLQQAAQMLVEKCDVLFSPNDNIVASGMTALASIALENHVPYYAAADSMVQDGAFATVGIDYEELGRETARMTVEVLKGKDPADIPIKVFRDNLSIYINQKTLDSLEKDCRTKLVLPEPVMKADNLKLLD